MPNPRLFRTFARGTKTDYLSGCKFLYRGPCVAYCVDRCSAELYQAKRKGCASGASSDLIPYRTFVPFDRIHYEKIVFQRNNRRIRLIGRMPAGSADERTGNRLCVDHAAAYTRKRHPRRRFRHRSTRPLRSQPRNIRTFGPPTYWPVHFGAFFRHLGFGSKCFSGKYLCGWSCFTRYPAFYRLFGCSRGK